MPAASSVGGVTGGRGTWLRERLSPEGLPSSTHSSFVRPSLPKPASALSGHTQVPLTSGTPPRWLQGWGHGPDWSSMGLDTHLWGLLPEAWFCRRLQQCVGLVLTIRLPGPGGSAVGPFSAAVAGEDATQAIPALSSQMSPEAATWRKRSRLHVCMGPHSPSPSDRGRQPCCGGSVPCVLPPISSPTSSARQEWG